MNETPQKLQRVSSQSLSYPPDWEDEERMHFLLAPFPPSSVRGLSLRDHKVHFWSSLIHSVCHQLRKPVFTGREIAERLKWNGHSPTCLPQVLQVMEQSGELQRWSGSEKGEGNGGWVSWGLGAVSSPVKWVWQNYMSPSDRERYETQYVAAGLVKDYAASLLKQFQSSLEYQSTDRVVTRAQFRAIALQVVEPSSVAAVEQELMRQGRLAYRVARNGLEIVKFTSPGERGAARITETDEGILSLKETIGTLQAHTRAMQDRIKFLKKKAKEHLQSNQKQLALGCLRRGKKVESLLAGKEVMLDNLQCILQQIQMAESDAMVLKAYNSGTEALKSIHKAEHVSLEEAQKTMVDLYEAVQLNEEISEALTAGHEGLEDDQDDLELELEAILNSSKEGSPVRADSRTGGGQDDDLVKQLATLGLGDPPSRDSQEAGQSHSRIAEQSPSKHHTKHTPQLA